MDESESEGERGDGTGGWRRGDEERRERQQRMNNMKIGGKEENEK